LLCIDIVICNN